MKFYLNLWLCPFNMGSGAKTHPLSICHTFYMLSFSTSYWPDFCSVVDGAWTDWGSYGFCSVTCGGGTQVRSRSCTNPAPNIFGEDCAGPFNSSRECNTQNCPSKKLLFRCTSNMLLVRPFTANINITQRQKTDRYFIGQSITRRLKVK
jgi:hypothetical protein